MPELVDALPEEGPREMSPVGAFLRRGYLSGRLIQPAHEVTVRFRESLPKSKTSGRGTRDEYRPRFEFWRIFESEWDAEYAFRRSSDFQGTRAAEERADNARDSEVPFPSMDLAWQGSSPGIWSTDGHQIIQLREDRRSYSEDAVEATKAWEIYAVQTAQMG